MYNKVYKPQYIYCEIEDLEHLVVCIEGTPFEEIQNTLLDWIAFEKRGEFLCNILEDNEIRALIDYGGVIGV